MSDPTTAIQTHIIYDINNSSLVFLTILLRYYSDSGNNPKTTIKNNNQPTKKAQYQKPMAMAPTEQENYNSLKVGGPQYKTS